MDGLEVELHPGQSEDGLCLVVVARGTAEAAEQAGALGGGSIFLIVGVNIPQ